MPSFGSGINYDSGERDPFSLCCAVFGNGVGITRIVRWFFEISFSPSIRFSIIFLFWYHPCCPFDACSPMELVSVHSERALQSFYCSQFPSFRDFFFKLLLVLSSLHYLSNVVVCSSFYDDFLVRQFHCFDNSQTSAQSRRLIMLFNFHSVPLFQILYITATL